VFDEKENDFEEVIDSSVPQDDHVVYDNHPSEDIAEAVIDEVNYEEPMINEEPVISDDFVEPQNYDSSNEQSNPPLESQYEWEQYYFERQGKKRRKTIGCIAAILVCVLLVVAISFSVAPISDYLSRLGSYGAGYKDEETSIAQHYITDQSPMDSVEIAERVIPSIVGIVSNQYKGFTVQQSTGSGFIISEDGYVVTNEHVISGATEFAVILTDGNQYNAKLIGSDSSVDIAVLKIDEKDLPEVELGYSSELRVGETVIAVGNPLGQAFASSVTRGIISGLNRSITISDRQYDVIQTDAAINEGNSGGALVNAYGQVIGINTAKLSSSGTTSGGSVEGMGFAIPIDNAKPIIDEIILTGSSRPRAVLNIETQDVNKQMSSVYRIPEGICITRVIMGGTAEDAGLRMNDIIVAANGTKVKTTAELHKVLDKQSPGDVVTLEIMRYISNEWTDMAFKVQLQLLID